MPLSDTHKHDRPPLTGEASEGAGPSGQLHRLVDLRVPNPQTRTVCG